MGDYRKIRAQFDPARSRIINWGGYKVIKPLAAFISNDKLWPYYKGVIPKV